MTHNHRDAAASFEGTVYYRQRGILLLAPSLMIGIDDRTHRRASIRLMLSASADFELAFADGHCFRSRAALLAPVAGRYAIHAVDTDFALLDFAVASPEYVALMPLLQAHSLLTLESARFASLLSQLKAGQDGTLNCGEVTELAGRAVEILTGTRPQPLNFDARVMIALDLIECLPLAEIKVPRLAEAVSLSPDRFRHLFRASTGCTVSQYARSSAVWRALMLLAEDRSVTDASHAVGFHDVSHFYKAYADLFGINLSEKRNIRKFRRVRCF